MNYERKSDVYIENIVLSLFLVSRHLWTANRWKRVSAHAADRPYRFVSTSVELQP